MPTLKRVTWMPTEGVEITAGETVLLSRGSRTIELGYANPLMPYVLTQHDAGTEGNEVRDNLGVFVGFRSQFRGSRFAGEFLIDDIQIDAADRSRTADQLAWRLFAHAPIPVGTASSATLEQWRAAATCGTAQVCG